MSDANRVQHELAKAQAAFSLVPGRQGRVAAWQTYLAMVAERVNSSSNDKSTVANTIQEFIPSSTTSPSGERQYQLVAWRSHPCGPVELGLVESVFRWSKKHRRCGCKLSTEAVPPDLCAAIQLRRLEPLSDSSFRTTARHPCFFLESSPQKDGPMILFQLAPQTVKFKENQLGLVALLDKNAAKQLQAAEGADFELPSEKGAKSMVFCADSFYPNQQGKASIKSYMGILRSMYERNCGKDLVNQDDSIIPLLPKLVTWKTLVERTPGYFETLLKATDISGKAPAMTNTAFSRHVWSRFVSAAPTAASQTGSFVSLLRAVLEIAPAALPV
ncbi:unnamed protein product [Symbiodinium sp. CCMP2456]|nr:unnamed protein product [Symbiodinium sp. CCMP2456]